MQIRLRHCHSLNFNPMQCGTTERGLVAQCEKPRISRVRQAHSTQPEGYPSSGTPSGGEQRCKPPQSKGASIMNIIRWIRRLFACPECGGTGGFRLSCGEWIPCSTCKRKPRVNIL
jgi:hypothetical protein